MNGFAENKKFITTAELKDMGYSYYKISKLEKDGLLRRVNRRTYENLSYKGDENDFFSAEAFIPNGVICLMSAARYYELTRIPVGIDIGFGDVVYPDTVKMDFPVILDMEPPRVNAYSLESSIAEKLEAIIHNGYLNSRYKDFYDIYVLSMKYTFSYDKLKNAVVETFENRKTPMSMNTAAFGDEFLNDPIHQTRWKSFLKKKKALLQISMDETIKRISGKNLKSYPLTS